MTYVASSVKHAAAVGEALAALMPEQQEGVRAYPRAATEAYGSAARDLRSGAD